MTKLVKEINLMIQNIIPKIEENTIEEKHNFFKVGNEETAILEQETAVAVLEDIKIHFPKRYREEYNLLQTSADIENKKQ